MRRSVFVAGACTLLLFTSCGPGEDEATSGLESAASSPAVALHHASSVVWSHHGATVQQATWNILVANVAYEKEVVVHAEEPGGRWVDYPAQYVRAAGPGRELWQASRSFGRFFGSEGSPDIHDLRFAVRLSTAWETHWDSNDGRDYFLGRNDGHLMPSADVFAVEPGRIDAGHRSGHLMGRIAVRNLGHDKRVRIHYSIDGWRTVQHVDARYLESYAILTYGSVPNPGPHGVELWQFEIEAGIETVRVDYAVEYTVAGRVIWDNNYETNYQAFGPARNVPRVFVRGTMPIEHWSAAHRMTMDGDHWWSSSLLRFGLQSDNVFKLDVVGDWTTSYGDDDADGVAELGGANIKVGEPGLYRVRFNDQTLEYAVELWDRSYAAAFEYVSIRGTTEWGSGPWASNPMRLVDHHVWEARTQLNAEGEPNRFKFDIFADWSLNFGDDDKDGIADRSGASIEVPAPGFYTIRFHDETFEYTIQEAAGWN